MSTAKVDRYRTKAGDLLWRISNGRRDLLLDDESMNEVLASVRKAKSNEREVRQ